MRGRLVVVTDPGMLRPRGLAPVLAAAVDANPVVVLRGARAVGKTTLAGSVIAARGGRLFRLDDPRIADEVRADPTGWLRRLRGPAVLDEAQQLPELLLAVKRQVDSDPAGTRLLLTGSVELPRDGLGGVDPLAGRVVSLMLNPLVQRERVARAGAPNLVAADAVAQLLFADVLEPADFATFDPPQRRNVLQRGGLPNLSLAPRVPPSSNVTEWVTRVIGDDLTGRFDRATAVRLLRVLAAETSSIQTVASLADAVGGVKHETLTRHLDRLESAFLVRRLPARRGRTRAAIKAHPKIHVTDSILGVWAGADEGRLLETFVVNDILDQLPFSGDAYEYEASYWRDERGRTEVDLVVERSDNQRVGIEIKSAGAVAGDDLRGLRYLRDEGVIRRGFVAYTGTRMYEIEPDLWALPMAALWEEPKQPRRRAMAPQPQPQPTAGPGQISVFLSYVHADDDTWGGAIVRTARDVVDMLEAETGETVRLFVDHDIQWGEEWRHRLSDELTAATFLMPIVTPRYLRSDSCRSELVEFASKIGAAARQGAILPLIWTMPAELRRDGAEADEVIRRLTEAQYVNWTDQRTFESTSGQYRAALADLAGRLQQRLARIVTEPTDVARTAPAGGETDVLAEYVELEDRLTPALRRFEAAVEQWLAAFASVPQPTTTPSAAAFSDWSRNLAAAVAPATVELDEARAAVEALVQSGSPAFESLRSHVGNDPELRAAMTSGELVEDFEFDIDDVELRAVLDQLDAIGIYFKPLRPHLLAMRAAVGVFGTVKTLMLSWQDVIAGR